MEVTLEMLAHNLAEAKREEDRCKAARLQAEADLAARLLSECPEEGSKTFTIGEFKAVMKRSFKYAADFATMRACGLAAELLPIKVKEELDEKGYKWLAANNSEAFAMVSQFVTRTPAKIAVSIEKKERL